MAKLRKTIPSKQLEIPDSLVATEDIINNFSTDPADATKVAGADAVYSLFQILASDDVNYDTLQEIVTFIKTIDTYGELVAAIDTAVGNDLWRKGGKVYPSFSNTINLVNSQYLSHTLTGAIQFTLGTETHVIGTQLRLVLTANGIDKPTFDTPFTIAYDNYENTNNVKNLIIFEYVGDNEVLVYIQRIA